MLLRIGVFLLGVAALIYVVWPAALLFLAYYAVSHAH